MVTSQLVEEGTVRLLDDTPPLMDSERLDTGTRRLRQWAAGQAWRARSWSGLAHLQPGMHSVPGYGFKVFSLRACAGRLGDEALGVLQVGFGPPVFGDHLNGRDAQTPHAAPPKGAPKRAGSSASHPRMA